MDSTTTQRGFRLDSFEDANGVACSIQESSAARDEGMIWFGCNEIGVKRFTPRVGWEDIHLEQDHPYGITHVANNRMHLSQSQVRALLPTLAYFAEHGVLPTH